MNLPVWLEIALIIWVSSMLIQSIYVLILLAHTRTKPRDFFTMLRDFYLMGKEMKRLSKQLRN